MTVQTSVHKARFIGNGVTTSFPFAFKTFQTTDLQLTQTSVLGVDTAVTSLYSVSLNTDQEGSPGGTITFPTSGSPMAAGVVLTVVSVLAETQLTDLTNAGGFFPKTITDRFDYLTILIQQHSEKLARVALGSVSDVSPNFSIGTALQRASKYLTFDNLGNVALAQSLPAATLSQATIGAFSNPQTPSEVTAGVTPTNLAYPAGNVLRYGADPTGVADSTTAIQNACNIIQPDGTCSVIWPPGRYLINSLTIATNGYYEFIDATLVANSSSAQAALVTFTAAYSNIYNMLLDCNWKSNYACALWWKSASVGSPSQSNSFFGLQVHNCLMGILFGVLSPGTPLNTAQSENYVYGFRSRGCQAVLYNNQTNGFVAFVGGELASSKNEWDIHTPGVYNYSNAYVMYVLQGVVRCTSSDLEKTDSTTGPGITNASVTFGGALIALQDCNFEIAPQNLTLTGGRTVVTGMSGGYWNNASNSWCGISGSVGGQLLVSGSTLNKDPSQASANTAFIDLGGGTGWDITLTDLRLENQLHLIFNNGNTQPEMWVGNSVQFNNVVSVAAGGGTPAPVVPRISSDMNNLLDLRGTDIIGNDIATWYKRDIVGVGAIALFADAPTGSNYFSSVQVTPQAGGSSAVLSSDATSLATIKNTAVKCRPGDQFMLSGWFRMTSAGTGQVQVLGYTTAGVPQASAVIADNTNLLTNAWSYISGIFTVPAACAYLGVGIFGSTSTVCRMVGIKLSKINYST